MNLGAPFIYSVSLVIVVVLSLVVGFFTVAALRRQQPGDDGMHMVFLAILWVTVLMFLLMLLDGFATHHMRRNTYARFLDKSAEEMEGLLHNTLTSMSIGYERRCVSTILDRMPIGIRIEAYGYRLDGMDFKVFHVHFGPDRDKPDRDENLLRIGPISTAEHERIPALIRKLGTMEEAPPSMVVYGRPRSRHDIGDKDGDGRT